MAEQPAPDTPRITFPQGLPGFPGATSYRLERLSDAVRLLRLQSGSEGGPGFLVLPDTPEARLLEPGDIAHACSTAGLEPEDVIVLFVATARRDGNGLHLHINRRAPVLVDTQRQLGFQVVLPRPDYAVRHALST